MTEKELLEYQKKYAHLIVVCGLNDVKGKVCNVSADLDQPDFVNLVVEELYLRGAKKVNVSWTYRPILKTIYEHTSLEELSKVHDYEVAKIKYNADNYCPSLRIESEDPKWMDGIDVDKVISAKKSLAEISRPFRIKLDAKETPWCLCTVPSVGWAKRIFPKLSSEKAVNLLWEKIFYCCRVLNGDPVENWAKFNREIKARGKWLNSLKIKSLHYKSSNGTDLVVGINKHSRWCGGAHDSIGNPPYNPNMPAMEIFTSPECYHVDGVIYATKPLSRDGQFINDFWFKLKDGKIIEAHAKTGEKYLKKLLSTDENSCRLGECSLVPFDSPVNRTKIVYYNTLFDENAVCHFAFGYSLSTTYDEKARNLNVSGRQKLGLNQGSIHIDFMVGAKDLSIEALCENNKIATIFKNGVWATKL